MATQHSKTSALILFLSLFTQTTIFAQQADLILVNGKIFTSDTSHLYVSALAIKEDKVLAIGNVKEIARLASSKTKRIDLKGKTAVPGFNDAHDHLGWLIPVGRSFVTPFSVPGLSKEAVIDSLSRLVKLASPRQWVYGTIGLTVFNDSSIRKKLLDSIAPHNPIMLTIMWGHGMILNTKALQLINVADTAPDPLGG